MAWLILKFLNLLFHESFKLVMYIYTTTTKQNSSLHKASLMSSIISREKHWETTICLRTPRADIFLSTFRQSVNDSKTSFFNWATKLNLINLTLLVNFSSELLKKLLLPRQIAAVPDKRCNSFASTVRKRVRTGNLTGNLNIGRMK